MGVQLFSTYVGIVQEGIEIPLFKFYLMSKNLLNKNTK